MLMATLLPVFLWRCGSFNRQNKLRGVHKMSIKTRLLAVVALFMGFVLVACGTDSSSSAPVATDYSQTAHWLSLPATVKKVDVFYLYPTAWQKVNTTDPNINEVDNASMRIGSNSAYIRQATAFETVGNVYAPYYRQADGEYTLTLPTLAEREQVIAGYPTLDAMAAFDYYIKHYNNGRPFILAGHSQGSNVLLNLLADYMKANPAVYARMVAAYVVGYSVTDAYLAKNPHLKFATGPDDTGVIISFNTQAPTVAKGVSPVALDGSIAINPITWTRGETTAGTSQGLGSFMPVADGYSQVPQYADATVSLDKGAVICSTADEAALYALTPGLPSGVYHSFDYLFYYFNIRANAANRVAKFFNK
jgi:pimeloyl-ACP methyl ester carboxylesterase